MNKILSMILCFAMLFALVSLTACDGKKDDSASKDDTSSNVSTTSSDATSTDDKKGNSSDTSSEEETVKVPTVSEGKLIMATNAYFQPYEFYDGDKIVGIDAEIAEAIAKKLGLTLEIKDMNFDTIITAVNAGDADVGIAGMTVTPDRLKEVDFSLSYAKGVQAIIVKEDSAITNVDDLYADGANQKVGVQLGTTGDIYCSDDFGAERVTQYVTGNEAVAALLGGDVDCVIIDNEPAKAFVANNAGLKILETTYADEDYAIAIKKGNAELKAAIDKAIDELTEDGTIDAIIDKYIK